MTGGPPLPFRLPLLPIPAAPPPAALLLPLVLTPLLPATVFDLPAMPSDVLEFWRCGITNLGGAWGVYCGGIELDDPWRTRTRWPIISAVVTGGLAAGAMGNGD